MSEKKQTIMLGFHSQVDSRLMREWLISLEYKVVEPFENTAGIDLVLMDSLTARSFMDKAFGLKREAKYFLPTLVCVNAGEDVGRWLKAGFDDALRLPVSKAEWRARIDIMLRLRSQSEELGRKSEMLHQALIESSIDHIFLLDTNGTYVTSNDRVDHLCLERGDEVVGKTIDQIYPQEVAPFYRTQLQRVLTEGKTVVFEHNLPSDQDTYHHLITLYPVNLPDGTLMVGGITRDITERKQAEEALKESEVKFQKIIYESFAGISVTNEEGEIILWNDALESITGIKKDQTIDRYIWDVQADLIDHEETNTKRKGEIKTSLLNVLKTGKAPWLKKAMEREYIHPDGTLKKVSGSMYTIKTQKGYIMVSVSNDITEVKLAEEKLKESEETYRNLFHNAQVGLYRTKIEDGKMLESNEQLANMFGYKNRNEFINEYKTSENYVDPGTREKMLKIISEKGEINNYEARFYRKDRSIFWAKYSAKVYPEKGWIEGVAEDTTERKQAKEELKKYREHLEELVKERTKELQAGNKELEAFSYSVSHDLRAPLRAINGFTRILMEDYVEKMDDEGKRLGSVIQSNAQKMGKLIDDLLAFSRLGRTSMQFSNINMKNMVNAIYHEASSSAERKRIEFSVEDLPDAYGDTNMLRQVWMNLISNAIKFSSKREKAVISITGIQDDEKTTYKISDNGAGFDMQYVNKIFEVFQRLHGEKEYPGTGVGLSLVQRIIHRHKGKIWAESEIDKGAVFYFSLPNKAD